MKADAIVFRNPNEPTLERVRVPQPGADEVVVHTYFSGVSIGTEQSIFSGRRTENGTFPLVGGYMSSGVVECVGSNVRGLVAGDRVVAGPGRLDGDVNGVFAGHVSKRVVDVEHAHHVPDELAMHEAAMFTLPCVGLHAINSLSIREQDTVVIQGQGLIGQFFGQWARTRGARVIAIEPDQRRAALSRRYVTPDVINPDDEDPQTVIEQRTSGRGADFVVEATGVNALIPNATRLLRTGSRMVFLAWYDGNVAINYHHHFHANEVVAYFPMGAGTPEIARAALEALGRGTISVGDNMTDIVAVDQACDLYHRIIDGDRSIVGAAIQWDEP